ncbi:MAG: hypothetical protein PHV59_03810 [Victivallales bacterium]|nr:hypothetical protein [Victivallales bacterium]
MDETKLNYIIAPKGWKYIDPIFTETKRPYTCLYFLKQADDTVISGTGKNGIFSFTVGRCTPNLKFRIADYLRYENRHNRMVIIGADYDFDIGHFIAEAEKSRLSKSHEG